MEEGNAPKLNVLYFRKLVKALASASKKLEERKKVEYIELKNFEKIEKKLRKKSERKQRKILKRRARKQKKKEIRGIKKKKVDVVREKEKTRAFQKKKIAEIESQIGIIENEYKKLSKRKGANRGQLKKLERMIGKYKKAVERMKKKSV